MVVITGTHIVVFEVVTTVVSIDAPIHQRKAIGTGLINFFGADIDN